LRPDWNLKQKEKRKIGQGWQTESQEGGKQISYAKCDQCSLAQPCP